MTEFRNGCLLVYLVSCSVWDLRFRRLPVWILSAGILLGTALEFLERGVNMSLLWNLMPGAGLCLLAVAAPAQLGMGDGWLLMGAGALAGWARGLFLLEGGLLFLFPAAFFWGVVRKKRKQEIPFAPFMLAACLSGLAVF